MLSQFMVLFGFFALVLVLIFWINKAVRVFDRLLGEGQTGMVFLEFTALSLPAVIGVVLPIAVFAAAIYVTNRLSTESELTVMQATGYSPWRLARPVLVYGLIAAAMMSVLTHVLIPMSASQLFLRQTEVSRNVTAKLLTEGEFLHPADGMTFYIREITADGALNDVFLSDRRDPANPITYTSSQAYLVQEAGDTHLVMVEGLAQNVRGDGDRLFTTHFEDFSYDISQLMEAGAVNRDRVSFTATPALLGQPAAVAARTGAAVGSVLLEGHSRITQALMCVIGALVGFATLLVGTYSRFGVWWQILGAFVLLVLLKLAESGVSGLVLAQPALWPLLYLPVVAGFGTVMLLLAVAARPGLVTRAIARARWKGGTA
ncbi:LPS export ABC transporter permease LptF [Roseovarius salinarum]|nr:LPS export ABC transporter permease LptF [Roseovarius salinarum]